MWKEQYIKMIGCVDIDLQKIEEAQVLKDSNLPHFLYKYRGINDFSLANMETDTVWLSPPKEYNDPFEFVEYFDHKKLQKTAAKVSMESILKEFEGQGIPESVLNEAKISEDPMFVIGKHHFKSKGVPDSKIDAVFRGMDKVMKEHLLEANYRKIIEMQEAMKVCSFCEKSSQLLMWSHYADNHKGICIEYDISKWTAGDVRRRVLYPVIYQKKFYDVTDHLVSQVEKGTFNNLYPIISGATKSTEWAYEKEWRFIFQIGRSFHPQNYPMNCQSKVFLGHRISRDNKERVLSVCRLKKIPVYQAHASKEKYELEFELIQP